MSRFQAADPRRDGFALIAILGTLAVLTTIVLSFGHRAVLERRAAAFSVDRTQVLYLARGAAMRGIVELRNKNAVDLLRGQIGRTSFDQRWFEENDMFERGDAGYFTLSGEVEMDEEECYYRMIDAESRVCINTAPEELLQGLEATSLGIVRKIMLRRDENARAGDKRRPRAYLSLEEFRSIENISDAEWYGTRGRAGLRDVLTVWGDGRININTCSREVLEAIPGLNSAAIEALIEYRAGPDGEIGTSDDRSFEDMSDVPAKAKLSAEAVGPLNRFCKVDSEFFTITAVATQRQGAVRAQVTATVHLGDLNTRTLQWREDLVGF